MDQILLTIDERDFQGERPSGAYLRICSERGPRKGVCYAQCNAEGLRRLFSIKSEYKIGGLSSSLQALSQNFEFIEEPRAIKHLSLEQDLFDPELRDISILSKFPNLESLAFFPVAPKQPIAEFAPQLRFLSLDQTAKTTLRGLTQLEGLRIISGPTKLDTCDSKNLKTLFLGSWAEGQGEKVSHFRALETLFIVARRKQLSFNFLHYIPSLKNFGFDGPSDQNWVSLPQNLQKVAIEKTNGSETLAKHLSTAHILSIGYNPDDESDEGYYRGDLLLSGDPFRTIYGPIFTEDIV